MISLDRQQCSFANPSGVGFPGDSSDEATPVPIPNTVVKFVSGDNTAGATWWEDSSLPGNPTPEGSVA